MNEWYEHILRHDLPSFIGKTLTTCDPAAQYLPNWHIDLIAAYLEAARRGELTRLIINIPPRSLKSICVSVAWPAWLLGHDPSCRIMAASYSAQLALRHSQDTRAVMNSAWYRRLFPQSRIARGENEKHRFATQQHGFRFATSVGGTATGEGGNVLIVDDPLSPGQAASHLQREAANRWFDHTFASRLNDKRRGVIVLVMQRLHPQDLTGHLLKKGGWEHLCLPAQAAEPVLYDFGGVRRMRAAAELLHPAREDEALVARARSELGSAAFAAQYQQQPLPEEGNMLRPWWIGRYDTLPGNIERRVQSWDTAIKTGARHDASVCVTIAESGQRSYVTDVQVMRCEYPDLKRAFYQMAERVMPHAILVEDRASGQQLIQDARREAALPLVACQPKSDKVTRFAGVSAMIEAGRLVLPREALWLAVLEAELLSFPACAHDDQVDAITQYLDWLRRDNFAKLRLRRL